MALVEVFSGYAGKQRKIAYFFAFLPKPGSFNGYRVGPVVTGAYCLRIFFKSFARSNA
jgi:hypothetical protein